MQTVGVGLIARNSEKTIKDCLESFINEVDQTVVVLAGESTDNTEEIVRSIKGIEVYKFDWIDDFSAARNFSFSKLKTDFLFWVDSDDELYQPENLRKLAENAKPEVGAIWLPYHYALDEFGNVTTVYERERLLRAKYSWIWKGRLHETVSPLNKCLFVRSNEVIVRHHHRAGGSRNDRNFHLLNIMSKEDPNDKRIWLYMGHQNFAANNWTEAAEWYLKFGGDKGAIPIERFQALCYCAKALRCMQDKQAVEVSLMAVELFPNYKDGYLELAQSYLMTGEMDKVIHWCGVSDVKELIVEPPTIIFVNPLDYTFNKYVMLSEAYMKKGDIEQAREYLQAAYQVRPVPELKEQIGRINSLEIRKRISDSYALIGANLLESNELTKLPALLESTPYWYRDLEEYKSLKGGIDHYTAKIKDEPQVVEGDDSVLVNIGNSLDPVSLLDKVKHDKVTVVCPVPTPGTKQIHAYSQRDMEALVMSGEGRHFLNLHKEPTRIICEYDHKVPKDLSIRLFLGQGLEMWSPKTITENGCGGSETSAAWLCREFAKKDCQPIIYAMDNEIWDGVIYRRYTDYKANSMDCHLFISSRIPEAFHEKISAEQKWLWFHDIHRWDKFTPEVAREIDVLIVLSQWHANFIKATYPFLKDAEVIDMDNNKLTYDDCIAPDKWYADAVIPRLPKIAIIGDAIDGERFTVKKKRTPHRFIWCSSPDRGLEEVLKLWPLIRIELPDAELKIFYGWDYFDSYLHIPEMRKFKERLLKLLKQDGVEWCGRVGQAQIARELMKSDCMLYPPPHEFRETYGISFLEAQAAGVICFYRENGALGETIGNRGIPLKTSLMPYQIVNKISSTLANEKLCSIIRKRARKYAMARSWDVQADKFLTLYRRMTNGQDNSD